MRHPNDKCYVCTCPATGSVFGMPVCAPCKKFVWRHRFSNLNLLRCEVGFGPQRNNCDLTRKRSCTKCRLRRSIEGNRRLRQFLEKNQPNGQNGKGEVAVNREHVAAMDKLRGFLAHKKPSTSDDNQQHSSNSSNDQQEEFAIMIEPISSDEESSNSLHNLNNRVSVINTSNCLTPVLSDSDSTGIHHHQMGMEDDIASFATTASPSENNANGAFHQENDDNNNEAVTSADDDNRRVYNYLMWAMNFVGPTYSTFTNHFVERFRDCSQEDYCQLVLLAAKNNGANVGLFGEALTAAISGRNDDCSGSSSQEQQQLPDVLYAFSLYFSLIASSQDVTTSTILNAIRKNPCFAQLANIPMQMVISNHLSNNLNLIQRYNTLLAR